MAHEIEHVELGQVSARVSELAKQKEIKSLEVNEFFPGYAKEEELARDLNGQKLAAKAGYSPAGMLTLLETFKALRKGEPEEPSEKLPTLSERIARSQAVVRYLGAKANTIENSIIEVRRAWVTLLCIPSSGLPSVTSKGHPHLCG